MFLNEEEVQLFTNAIESFKFRKERHIKFIVIQELNSFENPTVEMLGNSSGLSIKTYSPIYLKCHYIQEMIMSYVCSHD